MGLIKAMIYTLWSYFVSGVLSLAHGGTGTTDGSLLSSIVTGANGEKYTITTISELVTIAAAATSVSSSNLIPANAMILGVVARVTVVIPTAATFDVKITTDNVTLFDAVLVAAGTTADMYSDQNLAPFFAPTARTITITPNLTPAANTGRLRITTTYAQLTAPTS